MLLLPIHPPYPHFLQYYLSTPHSLTLVKHKEECHYYLSTHHNPTLVKKHAHFSQTYLRKLLLSQCVNQTRIIHAYVISWISYSSLFIIILPSEEFIMLILPWTYIWFRITIDTAQINSIRYPNKKLRYQNNSFTLSHGSINKLEANNIAAIKDHK